MPDVFNPQSKTIEEIFDGNVYYEIPAYQRPYSWESQHVDELWEDIYEAYKKGDEEYFLGSIILTKKEDTKTLDIVDGQQRLTTLVILFCALRDLYFSKISDESKRKRILGRIKNSESNKDRLNLRTQPQNQNTFQQNIINGIDFSQNLSSKQLDENKFLNTAFRFKEKITSIINNPSEIEGFADYILERVRIIAITCSNRSFAMKLFQVLNNRGLNLTAADLIKSFLMSKLNDENDQKTFEQDWIYIENKAKEFEEELTNLFTYYEYYLLAKNPEKSLYEELETQFRNKVPLKVINDFKLAIDLFFDVDSHAPKQIYPLYYLRHDIYWKSILLTSLLNNWDNEKISELARILKRFYYFYWIAGFTTSATKQTSFNIIQWIKEGKDTNYIKEKLNEKTKKDKVVGFFKEKIDSDNVYQYAWTKPLLILLEYEQLESPHMNFIEEDKNIHLEHVLPQAYASNSEWNIKPEFAEKLVNSLGNLTLLSGKRNIEASNDSFLKKVEIYKGKGKDGITPFELTKRISQLSEWNESTIKKRKEFILDEIERVFEIDFEKNLEDERNAVERISIPKESKNWEEEDIEYSEEYIKDKVREEAYNLLSELRRQLKEITPFKEKINKFFLGFKNYRYYFATLNWRQDYLYFNILDFDKENIEYDENMELDKDKKELTIKMYNKEDIKKYLPLIKYSKRYNESGELENSNEEGESEKEKLRFEFWEQLLERAKAKTKMFIDVSPSKYHWIGSGGGKSGISYNLVVLNSYVGCEIYLDKGKKFIEPNINKIRFDQLIKYKEEIEKAFGEKLIWERLDEKRASRISCKFDYGLFDKGKWQEMQEKMIDAMIRLEQATKKYVKELE